MKIAVLLLRYLSNKRLVVWLGISFIYKLLCTFAPPENELQKNSDRVLSEHELRVQRSLQKLNVPECFAESGCMKNGASNVMFAYTSLLSQPMDDSCWTQPLSYTSTAYDPGSPGTIGGLRTYPAFAYSVRDGKRPSHAIGGTRESFIPSGCRFTPAAVDVRRYVTSVQALTDSFLRILLRSSTGNNRKYKNAPATREGFLLRKRLSDASAASAARWATLNAKTTSLGSLGGQPPPPQLSPHTTSFGRWSTSRLNSNQTSPCSSTRSSVRGGSPLCSPSTRSSFSARQPYLGWRSQERLCSTPRTPHERLASSLLQSSRDGSASRASEEIQTSIKEVTSAIVHYVSGLEPANGDLDRPSPRSSQKLYWLESSFVGTKPLESPQTPLVVSEALPPPHPRPPSSLRLEHRAAPDWQETQRSVTLNATRPSPGSTTLEDVLDSLLGLPSQPARLPTPQPSPRKPSSPYYLLSGKSPRYEQLSGHSSWSGGGSTDVSPQPDSRAALASSAPAPPPPSAGQATVDSAGEMKGLSGGRGERGRRQSEPCTGGSAAAPLRRTSLDNGALRPPATAPPAAASDAGSAGSLHTENSGEDALVRCKHPKCGNRATPADARRHYKSCHNCTTFYCSRECRRAHWEKHRKLCLHTRVSSLCRQIIATAKEDEAALQRVSVVAHEGYLAHGRGLVKLFFTSSEAAEKFVTHGYQLLADPEYLKWTELRPDEMGAELYTEVVRLCKTYNPETRLILYVCVCVVSEVPTKGAVKWERRLVSRCAKLRLARVVAAAIGEANRRRERRRSRDQLSPQDAGAPRETLILTSKSCPSDKNATTAHKFREICFRNIQSELESRGVILKKHYPEVFSRLTAYVEGASDRFLPVTIYPKDVASGRPFVCVIMPDTEVEAGAAHPPNVTTIDVALDRSNYQLSTPM
ncbi:Apical junction component 1 homolog [Eumeta japonica]|uniref:Apical junction component 1 homolog n=1 Tax=Eumeta variegata TaxID=151549 RepID=A0A4C1UPM7_EUMVA|nr:Apical junction component 1 homolog [Eumeta japonica]